MMCEMDGVSLILKRRKLYTITDDVTSDYNVLGYYDQLVIKHITKWREWSPTQTEGLSIQDNFIDKYTIKGYFPRQALQKKLQKESGFDFEVWKENNDNYPFVVASVINLSGEFLKKCQNADVYQKLCQKLQEQASANMSDSDWENLHCAVLQTIGFSDFVILLKTDDLSKAMDFCESIRLIKEEEIICISSIYTFEAFKKQGLENLDGKNSQPFDLSVRVTLRPGITASGFLHYFEEQLDSYLGLENVSKNADIFKGRYRIIGDADCLISLHISLADFLPLYFKNESVPMLLNPDHELFETYICALKTELHQVERGADDQIKYLQAQTSLKVEEYRALFRVIIDELKTCIKAYNVPERIIYGLQNVMKQFLELIQSEHCFDVEKLVGEAFKSLRRCIEPDILYLKPENEEEVPELEDAYERIGNMIEALNIFREYVGDYLSDIQRSDSLFWEGRSLRHPSIGSATKLLFFYNGFLNKVKDILCAENENYSFLVMSGGTDQTEAIDLFDYQDINEKNVSLLILKIPEASLYDVSGSLFKLLHELLHFCGNRLRMERAEDVMSIIKLYIAGGISRILGKDQKLMYSEGVIDSLEGYLSSEKMTKISEAWEIQLNCQMERLKKKIEKEIEQAVREKCSLENEKEILFYGKNLYSSLLEFYEKEIFCLKFKNGSLLWNVYNDFMEFQKNMADSMKEILLENEILFSNVDLYLADWNSKKENSIDDINIIRDLFRICLGAKETYLSNPELVVAEEDKVVLETFMSVMESVFKECFADCMAAGILHMEMEDFVMAFIAEERNEKNAFPDSDAGRLRMQIDFSFLYGIEDRLSCEDEERLKAAVKRKKRMGFEYIEDAEKIIKQLNRVLDTEEQNDEIKEIKTCVCQYLEKCRQNWESNHVFEDVKEMQEIYSTTLMKNQDDIYAFLDDVSRQWISFAE